MLARERKILVVEFIREDIPREFDVEANGLSIHILRYRIGWDFPTAAALLRRFDGHVDAIVLTGIPESATYGDSDLQLHPLTELHSCAHKSPIYIGTEMERMFANWILSKAERKYPEVFRGRKALLHSALFTPYAHLFESFGARVSAADPLLLLNRHTRLLGPLHIRAFLRLMAPVFSSDLLIRNNFLYKSASKRSKKKLTSWIAESDIFVTYARFLHDWVDLKSLAGKVLVVDHLTPKQRDVIKDIGVAQIIELLPELKILEGMRFRCFGLLTAILDLLRAHEDCEESLMEYALSLVQSKEVRIVPFRMLRQIPRRCAFVIHALSTRQLVNTDGLTWMQKLPKPVLRATERALLLAPIQKIGQLRGAVSAHSGQEVICDLYGLPATPRRILEMRSSLLYRRLADVATRAQKEGSVLMGLGAYTKVAGDAGVTVARLSPIPVTTGNSYSSAATVWAAYEMVKKLGFVDKEKDGVFHGTAMVVGATGSIGRVSALLLAEKFEHVILVAPRPEKLLELKDEMEKANPQTRITLRTNSDTDLPTTDLIVTATSNTKSNTLDIMRVKPGAVICDCSRPLDISAEDAAKRPDVLVIESGEIDLPGNVEITIDLGLPKPTVYACLAETVILTMEGRYESFSLSRHLSTSRVKEIYEMGLKHGASLAAIQSQTGLVDEARIAQCRALAIEQMKLLSKRPK